MANETVIHTSLFVRGAQDPNIAAQRFAVFTGTGATDTNLLGYRTASGIVSDLGLPEVIDDEVANLLSGGTNISLTYDDVANKLVINSTGSLAGSGTANQVAFWNATGVTGENDLWWNPSSNFLGVGTNSPSNAIHVESSGATTAYVKTTSSTSSSAVQLANSSNNITSLQNYSASATGNTVGVSNASLSVLNATSGLVQNVGSGSIVSGIGGNQMMRVSSAGVVIGTGTSAARTLQVDGDFRLGSISGIMTNQILGRNSGNGDVGAMILGEGLALSMYTLSVTGTTFGSGATNQIAYWANASAITGENDLWWNPTSNFLGIGTNSPSNHLQINALSPSISLIGSTASGTSSIGLRNDTNNFSQIITYGSSNASTLYSLNLSNSTNIVTSDNIFITPTGGSLLVGNGVTEFFRATSSGLGVGGVIPTRTLHVAGTMRLTGSTATTPTNILARDNNGDISNLVIGTGLNLSSGALSVSGATGTGVTNQVAFWANTTTLSGETALWWNPSTDRLGIGTGAPAQTLDVAGTMRLTGSTGTSTTLMGRNGNGDISAIVVDGGLSLSGNVLSATGVTYGTGTTNYLTKWASSSGLTNSIILETGNTIDINGALRVVNSSGTATTITGQDANGYVSRVSVGTGLSLSGNTLNSTGVSGSGTATQVTFWGGNTILSGSSNLYWDATNERLGVGTSSPTTRLQVQGTTSSDGGVLGTELLTSSNWTSVGWTGNFVTGFTHSTGNTTPLTNTLAAVNGTYYQITYTVAGRTAGTFDITFGGQTNSGISASGNFGPRATSNGSLSITPTSDFNGTITFTSIRVVSDSSAVFSLSNSYGVVTNEIRTSLSNTNIFIGVSAGSRITTGTNNVSIGYLAGWVNTSGVNNTFIGSRIGLDNTIGSNNSFFGYVSGHRNITGNFNAFFGNSSGYNNTSGNYNSFFGHEAGSNNLTGSQNLVLGNSIDIPSATGSNQVVIKNIIFATGASGTGTTIAGNVGIGINSPNARLHVLGVGVGTGTTFLTQGSGGTNTFTVLDNGNVGVITSNPQQTLDVRGTMRLTGSTGTSTTVMGRDGSGDISAISIGTGLLLSGNTLTTTGTTAGTLTGTGTTNYLAKWSSASGLTDSIVFSSGNNVGINTNTPQATLDVRGTMRLTGSTGTPTTVMGRDGSGDISNVTIGSGLQLVGGQLSATGGASGTTSGSGATSQVAFWVGANALSGENNLWWDSSADKLGVGTSTPQRTLHVEGDMRLTGSTGTSTTVMGRDGSGDISAISIGTGLSLSGNILTTTGVTTGTVTGTGTTNYLSKWASASGLTDSIVLETGNTIDIAGALRVRTSSGTATSVMGRDANGYVSNLSLGNGLSISGGTLSFTGSTGGSGTLTGTGTTNYLSKWASASGLTDSIVYASGSNVGIGTSSPQTPLHILTSSGYATLRLQTTDPISPATYELGVFDNSLNIGNTVYVRFPRFGVATSNPQQTLDVAGTMRLTGSTGTPTTVMGRDGSGDISNVTIGSGLQLVSGTLSATGGASGTTSGSGVTSQVAFWVGANALSGENNLWWDSSADKLGVGTSTPQRTLHVEGDMRLTGSTGTSTTVMGRDGSGDISAISIGTGLSLSGNTLTTTGTTTGTLTGTGTTNYLSKWASASGLTDSIVLETGNTIDIAGALRVRTSSGTSTTIAGQDVNGYFSNITVGSGLSLSGNILTTTGVTVGTVTGTGTTNYLSKWASSSGLTDSIVFASGSNVGVNTDAPQQTLDVRGTMRLTGSTGTPTTVMGRDGSGDISNVTIGSGLQLVSGTLSATGGASGTTSGSGATSQVAFWVGANALSGENNLWWDSSADRLGVNTNNPQRTVHINGDMRLTGSTGTSTTVMGRDGSGDISAISIGTGLSLSGNTLTTTGTTSGTLTGTGVTNYIPIWDSPSTLTNSILFSTGSTVGVGVTTIAAKFHIKSSSNTSSTNALRVTDNSDRNLLNIRDDGRLTIGNDLSSTGQTSIVIQAAGSPDDIGVTIVPKGNSAITVNIPDNTSVGGNSRGSNAIDLQRSRSNASQVASGNFSIINGGQNNEASGLYSSINGGLNNYTISTGSSISGGIQGYANLYGQNAIASGGFLGFGDAQSSNIRSRVSLTGTTRTELTLNGATPDSSNRIKLNLNSVGLNGRLWNARIQISAIVTVSGTASTVSIGDSWVSEHIVGIKRVVNTTTIVGTGTIQNLISNDTSMSSALVSISADDTNDSLKIEFTPPTTATSDTVIRVLATVYLTEIGF